MRIAYVCTNFKNSTDTVAAVCSLRAGDARDCPVFVVDNASGGSHIQLLRELANHDERVEVLELPENVGYFRGLNIGLAKMRESYPDIDVVVAGNNDLLFPADFICSIRAISDRFKSYAVVSPDIVTTEGQHQNPHVISGISTVREIMYDLFHSSYVFATAMTLMTSLFGRFVRRGDEDQHGTGMEISQGHGSCYLLGPRFFSDFGELWAPTFLYGEEFFLSLQLERQGQRVFYEPAVQVTHVWHASVATLPNRRRWELARTAHRIYREHNPIWKARA